MLYKIFKKERFLKKIVLLSLLLVPVLSFASALKTEKDKLSYTLGHTVGKQLSQEKYAFNPVALVQGIDDIFTGSKAKITQEQMKASLASIKTAPVSKVSSSKDLKSDQNKASYTVGSIIGQQIKAGNIKLDPKKLYRGIEDVLYAKKSLLTEAQMAEIMKNLQTTQEKDRKASSLKNLKAGQAFMKTNAKKKGVISLANGIQYKVLKKGKGKIHPSNKSTVEVHYEGTFINGTVFDSSYKRGQTISFPLTGVIKGWTETIPLMTKGDTWMIYIPSDLAYGTRGAGANIGPNTTLIFKVALVDIK